MQTQYVCSRMAGRAVYPANLQMHLSRSHVTHLDTRKVDRLSQQFLLKSGHHVVRKVCLHTSSSAKPRRLLVGRVSSNSEKGTKDTDGSQVLGVGAGRMAMESEPALGSKEEGLTSSVGTPSLPPSSLKDWNPADQRLVFMGFISCVATAFLAGLLLAAIPSLLALKRAAQAFEKLADAAREELPGTMAAVRLSGMEISDLTMELSDLGQEISKGVRSSAYALTVAEDGMRQMGNVVTTGENQQSGGGSKATGGTRSTKNP